MSEDRKAQFADRFYPRDPQTCRQMIEGFLRGDGQQNGGAAGQKNNQNVVVTPALGAIAPHAGWMYSGSTAALSLARIAAFRPETVVVFGAIHVLGSNFASLYPRGQWETPFGSMAVDEELAKRVADQCQHLVVDSEIHSNEHSIEVELPFLRFWLDSAQLLPIMVRPGPWAEEIGVACASAAERLGRRVAFVASTDLTHYGPVFGFEPQGRGEVGLRWAKEINDRRFINLIGEMNPTAIVPEAAIHHNACGAGAVAATMAAVRALGVIRYQELHHTTSAEQGIQLESTPVDSVGYEAGIFPV